MVQLSVQVHREPKLWQPWLSVSDEARSYAKCKDVPLTPVSGGKWKRERRRIGASPAPPPEYPHKVAPGIHSEPIDMSTRRPRGSPPSYSQSLFLARRPTVITTTVQNPTPAAATPAVTSEEGGMCDPVIDEHFRRSLGKDYQSLFVDSNKQKKQTTATAPDESANLSTSSSLSVDDHFAKALGDTWLKLQKGESVSSTEVRHRAADPVAL